MATTDDEVLTLGGRDFLDLASPDPEVKTAIRYDNWMLGSIPDTDTQSPYRSHVYFMDLNRVRPSRSLSTPALDADNFLALMCGLGWN